MNLSASFHPDAQQELINAAVWYDDRRDGLGDIFVDAVSSKVEEACKTPERFPLVHGDIRQAIVRRFPFVVYFRVVGERVFVLSVFQANRDPKSLWSRLDP